MGKRNTKSGNTLTYETLPALFTGICDAIRAKDGTSAEINHQDIPSKIAAITTGTDLTKIISSIGRTVTGEMSQSVTNGTRYLVFCITTPGDASKYPTLKLTQSGAIQTPIVDVYNTTNRLRIYDVTAESINFYWNIVGTQTTYVAACPIT